MASSTHSQKKIGPRKARRTIIWIRSNRMLTRHPPFATRVQTLHTNNNSSRRVLLRLKKEMGTRVGVDVNDEEGKEGLMLPRPPLLQIHHLRIRLPFSSRFLLSLHVHHLHLHLVVPVGNHNLPGALLRVLLSQLNPLAASRQALPRVPLYSKAQSITSVYSSPYTIVFTDTR